MEEFFKSTTLEPNGVNQVDMKANQSLPRTSNRQRGAGQSRFWLWAGIWLSAWTAFVHVVAGAGFQKIRIRRNIAHLDPNGREIESMKRGIRVMKSKPVSDPTSWAFQANIHGIDGMTFPDWNACQHGSVFFLPWHRMYLYFFERILRKAANDDDLILPYWNYTDPAYTAIPEVFRYPPDLEANPLFDPTREMNDGSMMPPQLTDAAWLMRVRDFMSPTGSGQSFAGQWLPRPGVADEPHGLLELFHDDIHMAVGGNMGAVNTAGRDPIFWVHHAKVDQLWNEWMADGNRMPLDSNEFLNAPFIFYDENGQRVIMQVHQVLDSARQLGYRYDVDTVYSLVPSVSSRPSEGLLHYWLFRRPRTPQQQDEALSPSPYKTPKPRTTLGTCPENNIRFIDTRTLPVVFQNDSTSVWPRLIRDDTSRISLVLEGVSFSDESHKLFSLYLNSPNMSEAIYPDPHYIGCISSFGRHGRCAGDVCMSQDYDITELVKRQIRLGNWNPDTATISILPVSVIGPDQNRKPVASDGDVRFARIGIWQH